MAHNPDQLTPEQIGVSEFPPIQFGNRMELTKDGELRMIDGSDLREYQKAWFERVTKKHPNRESIPVAIYTQQAADHLEFIASLQIYA